MRILSWNLWWRYGPWEQRRQAIAATLAEVSPDVCGLQEVWEAPGENLAGGLAERLGMRWCWSAATKVRHVDGCGHVDRQRDPEPLADHRARRDRPA